MEQLSAIPLTHTLDIFGQYGGLIGLIIAALFMLLLVVLYMNARSRDSQTAAQNQQIAAFTTQIATQSETMAEAIRDGLKEQATHFLGALDGIRADHRAERALDRADRVRLMGTVERLTSPPAVASSTRPLKRMNGRS